MCLLVTFVLSTVVFFSSFFILHIFFSNYHFIISKIYEQNASIRIHANTQGKKKNHIKKIITNSNNIPKSLHIFVFICLQPIWLQPTSPNITATSTDVVLLIEAKEAKI